MGRPTSMYRNLLLSLALFVSSAGCTTPEDSLSDASVALPILGKEWRADWDGVRVISTGSNLTLHAGGVLPAIRLDVVGAATMRDLEVSISVGWDPRETLQWITFSLFPDGRLGEGYPASVVISQELAQVAISSAQPVVIDYPQSTSCQAHGDACDKRRAHLRWQEPVELSVGTWWLIAGSHPTAGPTEAELSFDLNGTIQFDLGAQTDCDVLRVHEQRSGTAVAMVAGHAMVDRMIPIESLGELYAWFGFHDAVVEHRTIELPDGSILVREKSPTGVGGTWDGEHLYLQNEKGQVVYRIRESVGAQLGVPFVAVCTWDGQVSTVAPRALQRTAGFPWTRG